MKLIFPAKKEDLGSGGIVTHGDITDRKIFRHKVFVWKLGQRKSARQPHKFGLMRGQDIIEREALRKANLSRRL